ncbi:hypothetical protein GE061_018087 [Apolygus lucorum]|uniref:RRM domain-containing protein n=1 Tax=Apolygus lucorum TaxID=248454 RepID=A0A8S9XEX6_APOLU|nr:hypothetical protein GE061_018087 [Apolygus lucorum]
MVFGRQETNHSMAPSPALTKSTLPSNSPVASINTTPSPFERSSSQSPNEETTLPRKNGATAKEITRLKSFPSNRTTGKFHASTNEKFRQSTGATYRRTEPKIANQSVNQFQSYPQGMQSPIICIPPRSTAKRQKKTPADMDRAEPPRCKRLHVSNIPFWFEDHHLVRIFQDYGNVVQAEVIYNERGSKGFGFVTFEDDVQATNIRKIFNGLELHGRVIEVNYASKRQGTKNRAQPQREFVQTVRPNEGNHRNDKGFYYSHERPNSAGAWLPLHRPNRLPRIPPIGKFLWTELATLGLLQLGGGNDGAAAQLIDRPNIVSYSVAW